jgi:enoyl-CoA hydratase/carnithine racemase
MSATDLGQQRITVNIVDGVADVRLNRADKMNALDAAMFNALIDTGERLAREPGLRAVVMSGEGRAFCAGLDMQRFGQMAQRAAGVDAGVGTMAKDIVARTHGEANAAQHAVLVWRKLPVPVIAAVHGVAFGGGFQVALAADMRFVAPDTRMSVMEIRWGLVPDMGGALLMRTLARADVIRELTYTGRVFSGAEALAMGFATRVCDDPHAEAMQAAREIAGKSPHAVRAAKRLLGVSESSDGAAVLLAESVEQAKLIGSANQAEAVRSNLEKRAPNFADPAPDGAG